MIVPFGVAFLRRVVITVTMSTKATATGTLQDGTDTDSE